MGFHTASTKEQNKATTRATPYTNGSNPTHAHTSTSGILPMPDRPLVCSHRGRPGEARARRLLALLRGLGSLGLLRAADLNNQSQ